MRYWSGKLITKLEPNYVFIFGSNPEGRNSKGAAKAAMKFGAVYGKGRGLHGQTYALVTKNLKQGFVETLPNGDKLSYPRWGKWSVSLPQIRENILELYACARENPDKLFFVPYQKDDNNLNGYSSTEIFNLFVDSMNVPVNMVFHNSFKEG